MPLDEVFQYPEGHREGDTVKAAVSRRYGPPDVVTVADVPMPEPRDDESGGHAHWPGPPGPPFTPGHFGGPGWPAT